MFKCRSWVVEKYKEQSIRQWLSINSLYRAPAINRTSIVTMRRLPLHSIVRTRWLAKWSSTSTNLNQMTSLSSRMWTYACSRWTIWTYCVSFRTWRLFHCRITKFPLLKTCPTAPNCRRSTSERTTFVTCKKWLTWRDFQICASSGSHITRAPSIPTIDPSSSASYKT